MQVVPALESDPQYPWCCHKGRLPWCAVDPSILTSDTTVFLQSNMLCSYMNGRLFFCSKLSMSENILWAAVALFLTCLLCLLFMLIGRRDYETKPPKLRLLAEIWAYPHRNDLNWKAEPEAPIDYCYVRPNHIPTINSMCHEFFWPGKIPSMLGFLRRKWFCSGKKKSILGPNFSSVGVWLSC